MPRIRVYEANQVGPAPTTRSRYAPADFSQSAGAALAEGMQTIGRTMGSVAIDLDKVQELADDTESRKLTLQYQERAASVLAAYGEAEGENVLAADKEARGELDKLATELVGMSTNDRMRKMTDERINQLRTAHRVQITETSAQKVKASADRTQKSQILVAKEEFVRAAFQDPAIAAKYLLTGQDLLEDQADLLGWSDEEFALKSIEQTASWHWAVFDGRMAVGDIDGAAAYRDAVRDQLTAEVATAMAQALKEPLLDRQAQGDFDRAIGTMPVAEGASTKEAAPAGTTFDAMVAVTAQSESGNRERDSKGRLITSSAGAQGKMQVMPGTNTDPGFGVRAAKDGSDAERTRVGRDYLAAMLKRYGGDPAKAWAAYNAGPGAVDDAIAGGGDWLARLPGETQAYVKKNVAAIGGGGAQQSARTWDKAAVYSQIDALADKEGWSPERRERSKQWADKEISRDEQLKARDEEAADREASKIVLDLGENFTSLHQIPADVRRRLSPDAARQYQNNAEVNKGRRDSARVVHNNSDTAVQLKLLAAESPEAFAEIDLAKHVAYMSPSDLVELTRAQQKIRRDVPKAVNSAGAISSTISLYSTPDMGLTGADADKGQYLAVHSTMSAIVQQVTGGKRAPTDVELRAAYEQATREVVLPKIRTFLGMEAGSYDVRKPLHQITIKDVPNKDRQQIIGALRSVGTANPTDAQIVEVYRNRIATRK